MGWKHAVTAALRRSAGSPTAAPPRPGDRLLDRPAFILSTVRSGSTLVRVLLDSHSLLHAPHELHLRDLKVRIQRKPGAKAMAELGLDAEQLEYLLWDRLLQREVAARGKRYLVNKTPNDVFIAERIKTCWPDARFIYLLRHPGAIARSRGRARPRDSEEQNVAMVRRYADALEAARARWPGHVLRYEDLTADPEGELRRLCEFLDVPFEPAMLEYDRFDHGEYKVGLGDWSQNIRSGAIQPAPPAPERVPEGLRDLCVSWGYGPSATP